MRYIMMSCVLVMGIVFLWIASSQWGIGYDPDSIIYEDVAENVFDGYGISRFDFATGDRYPMTNFPPFYPLVLGVLSQIFGSVADSARVLNTALWGCLLVLVYGWVRRDTTSHSIALFASSLLMLNLFVFQVFGTSWSEPLFLVLGFSGLWLVISYQRTQKLPYLMGAGVLFACAILTRYAGVALVATAGIVMLTASNHAWRKRILSILMLGVISGTPLLIWLMRNVSVRGDIANRDVGFTLVGLNQLETAVQTIGTWLLPIPELTVNLLTIGLMLVLIFWTSRRVGQPKSGDKAGIVPTTTQPDTISIIMCWWIVIYGLFVVASFTLLDPRIPFNYRILLPAWVGVMILVGRWFAINWTAFSNTQKLTWRIVVSVLLCLNALLSLNWAGIVGTSGQQYSSTAFQQSQLIRDIRDNPLPGTVYTNNNFLFHYLTDQPAILLSSAEASNAENWLSVLPDGRVHIVFFNALGQRGWTSSDQIEASLPLTIVDRDTAVIIYELEQP